MIPLLSVDWSRPMWVVILILSTIIICVLLTQIKHWIWRP